MRPGGDISDRTGHPDLAGACCALNPCRDVNGNASQSSALHLAFAGMDAAASLHPELFHASADRACAVDGVPRGVEAHEEAVARRVDLNALEPNDLVSDGHPILLEEGAPSCIAEPIGMIRRADDVGEEKRRE